MFTMTCPYCRGRGWAWRGVASNAIREECEECQGKGRGRIEWRPLAGLALVLVSFVVCVALIVWSSTGVFGATAGGLTLKQFRAMPAEQRSTLLAGAMAATEYVGMVCPEPQKTVGEYVAALTHRTLDESAPWIAYYFELVDEHGCRVPEGVSVDPKEDA